MMEESDLELFAQSLRQAIDRHKGENLDAALAEIGWFDALATDAQTAIAALFPILGTANASSTALEGVLAVRLNASSGPGRVVLPALDGWEPPGVRDGDLLTVRGLLMGPVDDGEVLVIVANGADGGAAAAAVSSSLLNFRTVGGMDPAARLMEVTGELPCPELSSVEQDTWEQAIALGRLAIGYQIVGAARAMLELARDHALNRVQFGQPIARFQALRHRLAETLVAIEGAEAVLEAGVANTTPFLAANAKAIAGRAGRTACRHCQQVLAGIGYTSEHEFHRYMKRTIVLDSILGSTARLTHDIGAQLLSVGHLPESLPL
jgi:hypothetical protein